MKTQHRYEFDDVDRQISSLLRKDGRCTATYLARQLGVTEGAIRKRLKRLTASKLLKIVGVVNPSKLGYTIDVLTGVQVSPEFTLEVARGLSSLEPVRFVGLTTGSFDIIFNALFRDQQELLEFQTKTLRKMKGVIRTETWLYLKVLKRQFDWFVADGEVDEPIGIMPLRISSNVRARRMRREH